MDKTSSECPNCGHTGEDTPIYCWREVDLWKHGIPNAKSTAIEIYCAVCNRTISVMPYHQFWPE